jgi:hypothetical protein
MSAIVPFRPRSLSAAKVSFLNETVGVRRHHRFALADGEYSVRWLAEGNGPDGRSFAFTDGVRTVAVRLADWGALAPVRQLCGDAGLESLPADIAGVAAEVALAPLLDRLGQGTGSTWRVVTSGTTERATEFAREFPFELTGPGSLRLIGELRLDSGAARDLSSITTRFPATAWRDLGRVPLPTRLVLGSTPLSAAERASLRVDDIVILERTFATGEPGAALRGLLLSGDRLAWSVELNASAANIIGMVAPPTASDDPPLTAHLTTADLSLTAVSNLQRGSSLPHSGLEGVTLDAGDTTIAEGDVVRIGTALGVRIRRIRLKTRPIRMTRPGIGGGGA